MVEIQAVSGSTLRVLTYHRIVDPMSTPLANPSLISATPADFDRQMQYLAKHYKVVSLPEVLDAQRGRRQLPPDATLITFDDAYRDFGEVAWPILRRYGLTATVFVPTAYPGDPRRSFWWDRLYPAFLHTSEDLLRGTPLGPLPLETPDAKRASLRAVQQYIKTIPHDLAMPLIDGICDELGDSPSLPASVLNWDELRELQQEGAAFAAHTRTHPALPQVSVEQARAEIRGSREDLKRELGRTLPVFAYPFGAHDERVAAIAGEEGFELAFSCLDGHNHLPSREPLRLRRTNITPRTSPLIFRLRLLRLISYVDRWRHRPTHEKHGETIQR